MEWKKGCVDLKVDSPSLNSRKIRRVSQPKPELGQTGDPSMMTVWRSRSSKPHDACILFGYLAIGNIHRKSMDTVIPIKLLVTRSSFYLDHTVLTPYESSQYQRLINAINAQHHARSLDNCAVLCFLILNSFSMSSEPYRKSGS